MKTVITPKNRIVRATLGLLIAAVISSLTFSAFAAEGAKPMKPMKGAEHLLMLKEVKTKQEVDALKTGDSLAMVCAKCKTVWTARVKQGTKGAQILAEGGQAKELIGTHACAGCSSELTVVGVQKGAHTELKHTCKACGDASAFCCATKPGAGATHGMEEKK